MRLPVQKPWRTQTRNLYRSRGSDFPSSSRWWRYFQVVYWVSRGRVLVAVLTLAWLGSPRIHDKIQTLRQFLLTNIMLLLTPMTWDQFCEFSEGILQTTGDRMRAFSTVNSKAHEQVHWQSKRKYRFHWRYLWLQENLSELPYKTTFPLAVPFR